MGVFTVFTRRNLLKDKSDSNYISLAENKICNIFIDSHRALLPSSATPTSALSAPAGLVFFVIYVNAVEKKLQTLLHIACCIYTKQ